MTLTLRLSAKQAAERIADEIAFAPPMPVEFDIGLANEIIQSAIDSELAASKATLAAEQEAIDKLAVRCGFPVVEDRIQVLGTVGNLVERRRATIAELREERDRAAEAARVRHTILRKCGYKGPPLMHESEVTLFELEGSNEIRTLRTQLAAAEKGRDERQEVIDNYPSAQRLISEFNSIIVERDAALAALEEGLKALESCMNHCYSDGTTHHQTFDSEGVGIAVLHLRAAINPKGAE